MTKTSIVIPAYGSYHLLDECLRRIFQNTHLENIEIIVVCNGCDQQSAQIVINNGLQLFWHKEPLGFTKAANIGLKLAKYPIVLLMNTDTHVLDYWPKNLWIERIVNPLEDRKNGVIGISTMYSEWGSFTPFFCTAIRKELFDEIGYLDEDFSPGYGEDLDFCIRARNHGYNVVNIDNSIADDANQMNISDFPVWHRGEGSFTDKDKRVQYLKNSHDLLNRKWGPGFALGHQTIEEKNA